MKILIFTEGTVLMPLSFKYINREQRVKISIHKDPYVHDFKNYIPNDNAVEKIKKWKEQGVEIFYLTSRTEPAEIRDIRSVLAKYNFPDNHNLLFRIKGKSYANVAEELIPDMLIEDDCESIGGEAEMTYPHIKPELRKKINSVVVREFGGISHLSDEMAVEESKKNLRE